MAKKAAPKGAKTKRKVSGKRGKAARGRDTSVDPRGVAGIVVLCVGLLALISQFIPSGGGLLNGATLVTRGLGGTLCLLLPVVLCWAGVTLVFFTSGKMSLKTMICGALLFVFVETLLQLFEITSVTSAIFADGKQAAYGTFLLRSYKNAALTCRGGGMIGALLAWPLYCALDVWGSVIVLIFACTMVLMVFTGVSFTGVGMYLSELFDDLRVAHNEHKEERAALRESREEEALRREAEMAKEREQRRLERERMESEKQARLEKEAREARMVQGDVGCGKTLIAFCALYLCVRAGGQGALMAPTEILAAQHFASAVELLAPLGITCGLLTGHMTAAERRRAREAISGGEWRVVIGTHALISEGVEFGDLRLVITDEQHRFGVRQRSDTLKRYRFEED